MGFAEKNKFDITCKYLKKEKPEEKVGLHVINQGKPMILEYMEMDPKMLEERKKDGELKFN